MRLILPDKLSEEAYLSYCQANPELRLERTAKGETVIVPPAGGESDYRSLEIAAELRAWAKRARRGVAFGSSVEFLLPDGAALSPDAAWVSNNKLARLSKEQRRKFLRLAPDFVAEVLSPSDRLPAAHAKCWSGWKTASRWVGSLTAMRGLYRAGRPVEICRRMNTLAADGALLGFTINLADLWAGL